MSLWERTVCCTQLPTREECIVSRKNNSTLYLYECLNLPNYFSIRRCQILFLSTAALRKIMPKDCFIFSRQTNYSGGRMQTMIAKTAPTPFAFCWTSGRFQTTRHGFSVDFFSEEILAAW